MAEADERVLEIVRVFEAPRSLVWDALTSPRHLLRWWGPTWCPLVSVTMDLRPGGRWRGSFSKSPRAYN